MKDPSRANDIMFENYPRPVRANDIVSALIENEEVKNFFQRHHLPNLDYLLTKLSVPQGKKSFLVFRNNKYITVLTDNITCFYVNHESPVIRTFDGQEYFANHSLDQIQELLPEQQFFRLNRQYLVNFNAVKEVEHYFGRKLLVNLVVPTKDKLLVSKEKVRHFLHWLDNR